VAYDGVGNAQVSWNGGRVHAFSGVASVDLHSQGARRNKFTFQLVGRASAALALAPGSIGRAETAFVRPAGAARAHPLGRTPSPNHGNASQSGVVLTVDVDYAKGNSVTIGEVGAGAIKVTWNDGLAHSFSGVSTIIVHASRARNDYVIFA
jgi:hypothetical protein